MPSSELRQPLLDAVFYVLDATLPPPVFYKAFKAIIDCIRIINLRLDTSFKAAVYVFGFGSSVPILELDSPVSEFKKAVQISQSQENCDEAFETMRSRGGFGKALRQVKEELQSLEKQTFKRVIVISGTRSPCVNDFEEWNVRKIVDAFSKLNVLTLPILLSDNTQPLAEAAKFWEKLKYLPSNLSEISWKSQLSVSIQPINVNLLGSTFLELVESKTVRKPVYTRGRITLGKMAIGVSTYKVFVKWEPSSRSTFMNEVYTPQTQPKFVHKGRVINPEKATKCLKITPAVPNLFTNDSSSRSSLGIPVPHDDVDESMPTDFQILCFTPTSKLSNLISMKSSTFLVGSNFKHPNSKPAFASLHRVMRAKQVAAYCLVHHSSTVIAGYLFANPPTQLKHQVEASPSTSTGMYFVRLPFRDNIRPPVPSVLQAHGGTPGAHSDAKSELPHLMHKLIKKFRNKHGFNPNQFENPDYLLFSNSIESAALGTEFRFKDYTIPYYEGIHKNAQELVNKIKRNLQPQNESEIKIGETGLSLKDLRDRYPDDLMSFTKMAIISAGRTLGFRAVNAMNKEDLVGNLRKYLEQ